MELKRNVNGNKKNTVDVCYTMHPRCFKVGFPGNNNFETMKVVFVSCNPVLEIYRNCGKLLKSKDEKIKTDVEDYLKAVEQSGYEMATQNWVCDVGLLHSYSHRCQTLCYVELPGPKSTLIIINLSSISFSMITIGTILVLTSCRYRPSLTLSNTALDIDCLTIGLNLSTILLVILTPIPHLRMGGRAFPNVILRVFIIPIYKVFSFLGYF